MRQRIYLKLALLGLLTMLSGATSNATSNPWLAPEACPADTAFSAEGYFLLFACLIAGALLKICMLMAHKVQADMGLIANLMRTGTMWVINAFFVALGITIAGGVVNCSLGCTTYATDCSSISCVVAIVSPDRSDRVVIVIGVMG